VEIIKVSKILTEAMMGDVMKRDRRSLAAVGDSVIEQIEESWDSFHQQFHQEEAAKAESEDTASGRIIEIIRKF
jgi:hypothetical protein